MMKQPLLYSDRSDIQEASEENQIAARVEKERAKHNAEVIKSTKKKSTTSTLDQCMIYGVVVWAILIVVFFVVFMPTRQWPEYVTYAPTTMAPSLSPTETVTGAPTPVVTDAPTPVVTDSPTAPPA